MPAGPPSTIAIDGPAAGGKSTIGKALAERLDYLYLDTGAMYRAVTLLVLEKGLDPTDDQAVAAMAATPIEIGPPEAGLSDGRPYTVAVGDRDITWAVRSPLVDVHVSTVAANPAVRRQLVEQQRRIGQRGRVVMVGRDIGTVVMPEADLKIYLDASAEERARRRHAERLAREEHSDYESLLGEMHERDRRDASRETSPMRPAEDAYIIDSTGLSADEVVDMILELIAARET
ncbi:MAG TPA: (d)CMP kinase [Ardenticatenaceae bacterium]|nr:(d)CMP kinase [Ardenticatenaceae bacterium]